MRFTTDKQTLDDLNIFGRHGEDSVFQLFNRTMTRGGAGILEEMFRYPLSEEASINHRSGIIQFFADASSPFPFDVSDFDAAEQYLAITDERTRLSPEQPSLAGKLASLVGSDAEYKVIQKGVTSLVSILGSMREFVDRVGQPGRPGQPGRLDQPGRPGQPDKETHAFAKERDIILGLLNLPAFEPVLASVKKDKLPYTKVAELDAILRFRHREPVRQLLQHCYYLDVYLSVARVAQERKFVFPIALQKQLHTVILEGVYHPGLKQPVPNSLQMTPDSNLVFLTGANMAGKSTFMKSLGIALFLAHMGFPVPAARMEFSVRDGIYTTINLPDDLGMGASHFYAEVLRLKKMARELHEDKALFIIFDELFRGTNVRDAYEATVATVTALAAKRESLFVISTHIIEAGEVLRNQKNTINFVYLPTRMKGTEPVYTYTLESGLTADRHGMIIINNEGILDILRKRK